MKAGPLKSWLAKRYDVSFFEKDILAAAASLADRLSGQGLKLLVTDDPWFVRELVEEETDRLKADWHARDWDINPMPADYLPVFRQGADPCFGDRNCLGIVGVEPSLPMRLLTTNLAIEHFEVTLRLLIEKQGFWSDDPAVDRKGIEVKVETSDPRVDSIEFDRFVHSGAMWITPRLRGKRPDGPPLATSLAPLMRLCAWLHFSPDLLVGTVADPKLTRTFGSRVDGEIILTENGQTSSQSLHVYDKADMEACARSILQPAEAA